MTTERRQYEEYEPGRFRPVDTIGHDRGNGHRPDEMPDFNLTDAGNAEYFTHLYGDRLRYDHRRGLWYEWRKHYWKPQNDGVVGRLALESVRKRYETAVLIEDLKARETVAKHTIQSEQRARLEALVALARNMKPIADDGEDWNADPWLLCVRNGIVGLRTGELRDGKPEDRINQQANVTYDPDADCPRWLQFQLEVASGNADLVAWKQKLFGYFITGITNEQIITIKFGNGANGKGREDAVLRHILGDYAYDAPFSTFELYNRATIPNDLAALVGRRLITSSETNENTRLNEARVKALSGEDSITARFLHAEFFTFQPVGKLSLSVNYRPRVYDDSYGFWRRVRLVPYLEKFMGEREDKNLLDKLLVEKSGILNWILEGVGRWQTEGLDPVPDCITNATIEYEADSDPLAQFILDECVEAPQAQEGSTKLYRAYIGWCDDQRLQGRERLSLTVFGRRMGQRFTRNKERTGMVYHGIGLKCEGFAGVGEGFGGQSSLLEISNSHVGKTPTNPSQPFTSLDNPSQSGVKGFDQPFTTLHSEAEDRITEALLMSAEDAIATWEDYNRPVIELAQGTKCTDLAKLLSNPDVSDDHLAAVRWWLDSVREGGL